MAWLDCNCRYYLAAAALDGGHEKVSELSVVPVARVRGRPRRRDGDDRRAVEVAVLPADGAEVRARARHLIWGHVFFHYEGALQRRGREAAM